MTHLAPLLAALLAGVAPAPSQDVHHPVGIAALAGTWRLNEALSDEIPMLPGEAMAQARAQGTVSPRVGTPVGPRLGRYYQIARVETAIRESLDLGARVTITRTSGELLLSGDAAPPRSITPDGRKVRVALDGVRMDMVAELEPPVLVVEQRFEDGTRLRQRYAAFAAPRQLVVISSITGPRLGRAGLTVRRVYDHAP